MPLLHRHNLLTVTLLVSISLTGCASYQVVEMTAIDKQLDEQLKLPESFSLQGQAVLQDKSWLVFQDAQLNALIEQALADNFSLRSRFARVKSPGHQNAGQQ